MLSLLLLSSPYTSIPTWVVGFASAGATAGFSLLLWARFSPLLSKEQERLLQAKTDLAETIKKNRDELSTERDQYRDKLHESRQKEQALLLQVKEMEGQPNLSSITTLLENQTKITEAFSKAFQDHAEQDATIFGQFQKVLENMNQNFEAHRAELMALLGPLTKKKLGRRAAR